MKLPSLLFTLALLAACSAPSGPANSTTPDTTTASTPPAAASTAGASMASMPEASPATSLSVAPDAVPPASATGVVKAIDPVAKTITLDHGPVAALNWPAMVMTFKTGDVDVSSIKPGDHVTFEFLSNGMDATLTKLDRQ